jgi:hypothetical protein
MWCTNCTVCSYAYVCVNIQMCVNIVKCTYAVIPYVKQKTELYRTIYIDKNRRSTSVESFFDTYEYLACDFKEF